MTPSPEFALLNIDKPLGMTSHDVVAIVRRETRIKKVGHAGTLDPLATGVLMLCMGQATRLSEYVMGHPKIYRAQVRLGIETETYDAEGQVVATNPTEVTLGQVEAILPKFLGDIQQVPPIYSAIKVGGQKLYDKARRGDTDIELTPRSVTIYDLKILEWQFPLLDIWVHCSPGTYIRSLAHDIGAELNVGAHLAGLRRTASGPFRAEDAVTVDALRASIAEGVWQQYLTTPDLALADFTRVDLDSEASRRVGNGLALDLPEMTATSLLRAYDSEGKLLAILEPVSQQSGHWKPLKVFNR
jgi:tRNA pseudouridine55 synthase